MIQEIIVYIILAFTFGLTIYKSIGFFSVFKATSKAGCNTCSSGACSSCSFQKTAVITPPVLPLKIISKK